MTPSPRFEPPVYEPSAQTIQLRTLAQLTRDGSWRLDLAHDSPDHLLIWITRGQGVGVIDGAKSGLGAHNAVFIPARSLFSLSLGRQALCQILSVPDSFCDQMPATAVHLRLRSTAEQAELATLFDALGREQSTARPDHHRAMAAYAELVSIWLNRQNADQGETRPKPRAARRLSQAFCARLVTDFASGSSMADHAAAMNITPTHLTRVCKAEIGKSAAALVVERQLHAARRLLADTDLQVQEIAQHLGFGSAAYFTRFIQQHTGISPSGLRRTAHKA